MSSSSFAGASFARWAVTAGIILGTATDLAAQQPARDTTKLPDLEVTADRPNAAVPPMQRNVLPVTSSITAARITTTVNLLDVQDAVKYLPSLFVRKRNNGDTQSTLGTRTWGVGSSARSLIFADGVPLTALIANNNTIGGPRWGLVSPEEIVRVDVMQGPFSAAYAGNSMGAVVAITTRQPDRFEGSISQTQSFQRFGLYGTRDTYLTSQTGIHLGDRIGKFSFWVSGTYANSESQPLTYVTAATNPTNATGGFPANNKLGAPANVLGATGLLHTDMVNARVKLGYDVTPNLRATYSAALWHNGANAGVETYIDSAGKPTYGRVGGFASGYYDLTQTHSSHSVSLRSQGRGNWDYDVAASLYRFNTDRQRFPSSATGTDTSFSTVGRTAILSGTGWGNLDLSAGRHLGGRNGAHLLSFGVHADRYRLDNPTYNVPDWKVGDAAGATGLATLGQGTTRTLALWAQERWRISKAVSLTLGGRLEGWRAFDGVNVNGATRVDQEALDRTRFSPKATVAWQPSAAWQITASAAKAYRYPTATELYQLVTTGSTFTSPDPTLKPDDVFASELRVERRWGATRTQLALFRDDVHDAIISQFLPLVPNSTQLYSYLSNVDHIRLQGAEWSFQTFGAAGKQLDLAGSVTYLDSEILALSGRASATAPAGAAIGKQVPNVPKWRWTANAVWHPGDRFGLSVGARYSSKLYTTLDNADVNPNTYQGFTSWFVMDVRGTARLGRGFTAGLGVDNLNNRKYFLFHPFPQRTLVGDLRYTF